MVMNPCKKNQDKAIKLTCEKIGGEYYGPSGKSIEIDTGRSLNVFLEYNKNSESLKEIEISDRIKLYQAVVLVEREYLGIINIKYPIKILINVIVEKRDMSGFVGVSFDGELKVESIMEAIRLFKSDIINASYDEALGRLDFKDNLQESLKQVRSVRSKMFSHPS